MKKESYDLIMKSLADRVSLCGMYLNTSSRRTICLR
jgi:hypothetical protein